jgi:hypothetical protein
MPLRQHFCSQPPPHHNTSHISPYSYIDTRIPKKKASNRSSLSFFSLHVQKMWSRLAIAIALRSKMTLSLHNGHLINNTFRRLQDKDKLGESMGIPSVQAALRYLPLLIRPHCATANPAALRCLLPLISPPRPPQLLPLSLLLLTSPSKP